jgi:choline-sulfatase
MSQQQRPNVLLIMADQMTPFAMGAYGNRVVKTPNLDTLAAQSVRFDAAYSPNPLCAPARACLMTGEWSSRIGVHDNASPLSSDQPTIAHHFTRASYDAAWSGKMHFVGPDQHHGLRRRLSHDIYPANFSWVKSRDKKVPGNHAAQYIAGGIHVGRIDDRRTPDGRRQGNMALDVEAHDAALRYLEARSKTARTPFFLGVSYNYPHEPFWPPKDLWDAYEGLEIPIPEFPNGWEQTLSPMDRWLNRHHGADRYNVRDPASLRTLHRAYYALVTWVDSRIGELLRSLRDNGLAEKTIIVFTSDHGDMLGHKGMVQKRSFYEWSARVPLLIKTRRNTKWAGATVPEPVSLCDIAPTLLELAGVSAGSAPPVSGQSLVPLMSGERDPRRLTFSESHSEGVYATCFMARQGKYKYVLIEGHASQLFDLQRDPSEWDNLAGSPQVSDVEKELRSAILDRFNPQQIERELRESIARREAIQPALTRNGRDWNFTPDPVD